MTWPRTDIHIHATYHRLAGSRAEMTVTNIVRQYQVMAFTSIGIVEHLDTNPKHPLACLEALVAVFRSLPSEAHQDIELFVGAELDYQGNAITIANAPAIKHRLGLDYYLAAAHGLGDDVTNATTFIENHHRRLMGIVEKCDYVDVVAHPWCGGRRYVERGMIEDWQFDLIPEHYLREFIDAAKSCGKAIEINPKAMADADDPGFRTYLQMLRQAKVPVAIGSDAHSIGRIGQTSILDQLLENAEFDPAQVWTPARTWS
jgi:histidinol phosphatase-like PHP family hydrolase